MNETTVKKGTQKLPCKLTEDEQRLRGIALAEKNTEFVDTKEAAAAVAKTYRDTLKGINDTIYELKDAVSRGVEMRVVEVEYRIDIYLGNVTVVRMDTNEELLRRRLTPDELQGPGKNLPQVAVGVKDTVAEWPACGWLEVSGYNVAQENGARYSSYNPFAAPKRGPPTDAQILTALPVSRLVGKHVSVVPVGDSITHGIYLAYPALLNSLYAGKFTYYDGGVSGSNASQWLPSATGSTHPSSGSGENYYNYVLHRAQEATAAGDIVIIPYCLGHNIDSNQIADDATIIGALTAALPNAYILVRPTRTTHKVEFTGAQAGDIDAFYLAASDAQRALADASSTDKILHGSEEFFPFFFSNQSLIDTGVTHPLPGEGQTSHARIEVKSLALTLASILPVPISTITVSPATIALTQGQTTQTFTAVAKDNNGVALSSQPTFTWSASAPVVSSSGVLTVPMTYTVTATASGISGTASATLPTIATPSYPAATNVRSGVNRGDGMLGTLVLPSISNVLSGIGFGAGGTEFIGTATTGGGSGLTLSALQSELDARGLTQSKVASLPTATQNANAVLAAVVDGSLTVKQAMAIQSAIAAGRLSVGTLNTSTHTQTTTYYKQDGTTALSTSTTTYDATNSRAIGRTVVYSNLP